MGLLTRLREWLAGGSTERDGEASEKDDPARSETDARDATDPPDEDRLDPEGVTETRSVATDDAVDKLQEVRGSAPAETPTEEAGAADDSGTTDTSGDAGTTDATGDTTDATGDTKG
jgi:hypothetical protein